ncbi:hypothetical protein CRUP_028737 [Coryphaenoides rupestris]|nr:hypothetical protein CRUP_028737 [Coryphaenoides rupestris]
MPSYLGVMAMVLTWACGSTVPPPGSRLTCSERKALLSVFLQPVSRRSPSRRFSASEASQ